jgi:hypothetical protein
VGLGVFAANGAKFEEPLLSHVRSQAGFEVFQTFVAALECTAPVLMAEKMHDLLFLCNEFGFTGLLFQVPDFISGHLIAESEAPRRGSA